MDLQELETRARQELLKYGLQDWTFKIGSMKRQLGVCKYRRKQIEIAEYYARNNPRESVLDTLLHEIAHALAGPTAQHGPIWKALAMKLGATPTACDYSPGLVVKPGDWQAACPSCNKVHHRYQRPKSLTGYCCRCPARTPLVFAYTGNPACAPAVPQTPQEVAKWFAQCAGCHAVHQRLRRPKGGVWHCRCVHGSQLTWRYGVPQRPGGTTA